jgi:hypothetical protein
MADKCHPLDQRQFRVGSHVRRAPFVVGSFVFPPKHRPPKFSLLVKKFS